MRPSMGPQEPLPGSNGPVAARNLIRRDALAVRAGLSEVVMIDNRGNGKLGLILGVLIAIAAVAFLLNGGRISARSR